MKRVLLDCDGVLSDFSSAALAVVNRMTCSEHRVEDIRHFDFCASLGLTKAQAARVKKEIGATPGFALGLAMLPGAVDGVRRLREIAEVFVVTSPWNSNPTWMHERESWLWERLGIPARQVIHTSAKHVCSGDFLVDDKTDTLTVWGEHHPAGTAIQWVTHHNRLDGWDGAAVESWDELIALVEAP